MAKGQTVAPVNLDVGMDVVVVPSTTAPYIASSIKTEAQPRLMNSNRVVFITPPPSPTPEKKAKPEGPKIQTQSANKIVSVSLSTIVVSSYQGPTSYEISKKTEIRLNGIPASTGDLVVGMDAFVAPTKENPGVAQSIDAKFTPKPSRIIPKPNHH